MSNRGQWEDDWVWEPIFLLPFIFMFIASMCSCGSDNSTRFYEVDHIADPIVQLCQYDCEGTTLRWLEVKESETNYWIDELGFERCTPNQGVALR